MQKSGRSRQLIKAIMARILFSLAPPMRFSPRFSLILMTMLLLALMIFSLTLGRFAISYPVVWESFQTLFKPTPSPSLQMVGSILWEGRLPRILTAVVIGGALGVTGAVFQGVFRNPLVSSGALGVLNGSAFGAALGLLWQGGNLSILALAGIFGGLAVLVAIFIARKIGSNSILFFILGGIISNALFAGLLSLVKYVADPEEELPSIVYWLLGSLSNLSLPSLYWMLPTLLAVSFVFMFFGRALDVMSSGDEEALSLGVPVVKLRYLMIFLATLASAMTVCIAGVVGWVGLLVPHLARLLFGASHRILLPMSGILGAIFLLLSDDLARTLSQSEIPLGVVTELLGASLFFLILGKLWRGEK